MNIIAGDEVGEVNVAAADFIIRRMNRDEVSLAIEWAADEGWNPGLHDAECFYVADPDGFRWDFVHNPNLRIDADGTVHMGDG